jgi:hypothetical protein
MFLSSEPGEHGHRRRYQRARRCAGANDIGDLGSYQWPACAAFPRVAPYIEDLLDHLSEGDRQPTKIVTFRDRLLAEASQDLRQLKKLGWSLKTVEADR